jgi:hypothetical protein
MLARCISLQIFTRKVLRVGCKANAVRAATNVQIAVESPCRESLQQQEGIFVNSSAERKCKIKAPAHCARKGLSARWFPQRRREFPQHTSRLEAADFVEGSEALARSNTPACDWGLL